MEKNKRGGCPQNDSPFLWETKLKMSIDDVYVIDDLSLDQESLLLNETIFHNANGYIGVRSNFEEGYRDGLDTIRGSYINGFYDFAMMNQAEKLCGLVEEKQTMLNVADTQGVMLDIDGERFSMFAGKVLGSRRFLHMSEGYTARQVYWESPVGHQVEILIKRMTSFVELSLFTIEYSVKALNFDGRIRLISTHIGEVQNYFNPDDPRVAGECFQYLVPVSAEMEGDLSVVVTDTSSSGLTVCTAVKHRLLIADKNGEISEFCRKNEIHGHGTRTVFEADVTQGQTVTLEKYTIFTDSIRYSDCRETARQKMDQVWKRPLKLHYADQKAYMDAFWSRSMLEIRGDDDLSIALKYNMYQLLQSAGKDACCNIAAKGLSGEGYEGHYFWDTEMYMQPFFTLTNPDISRNLIAYRYSILDAARENARILGHKKGALYPWRTIMGKECSGYFPSGTAQYHIDGDIAYSVVAYYLATKDMDFIAEKGAEIVFETARLWMDTGHFYQGQFRIHDVTGPDEYTCMVNNNYFTNASAQYNLHWAVRFYELLSEAGRTEVMDRIGLTAEEVKGFRHAEESMYLPYDEELGINPQDDSFLQKPVWDFENTPKENYPLLLHYHPLHLYRFQVCKQADTVLAHFIYEDAQSMETIRKSFDYYEKITTHDSSLSTCIYSIVAAKLGDVDKAYDYFGDSAKLDLFNLHHNTRDGIHTANMGGNYMAVVYGFGGLRLKESGIWFAPQLPKQWESYRFQVLYEGSRILVEIDREKAVFTLSSGEARNIHIYGKNYTLKSQITIERQN